MEVIDSATEEVIAPFPRAPPPMSTRRWLRRRPPSPPGPPRPVDIRAKYLRDIGSALAVRFEEIADTISAAEVGSPKSFAQMVQAGLALGEWESFATLVEGYDWEEQVGNSLVVREAHRRGRRHHAVELPALPDRCKVVPALAAGCTVVLKPSEVTPLNAYLLTEVIHEVGLPAGVFNMVVGTGPVVGEAMSTHPDIDMISFTGSGRAGAAVTKAAADTVKRVGLGTGRQVGQHHPRRRRSRSDRMGAVFGSFINSGQTCSALTRVLVPESRKDEYIDAILAEAAQCRLVDPKADEPDIFQRARPDVVQGPPGAGA